MTEICDDLNIKYIVKIKFKICRIIIYFKEELFKDYNVVILLKIEVL
jgi:hypothetical protein